jgi:hypothetical protein
MNAIQFAYMPFKAATAVSQGLISPKVAIGLIILVLISVYFYAKHKEESSENLS